LRRLGIMGALASGELQGVRPETRAPLRSALTTLSVPLPVPADAAMLGEALRKPSPSGRGLADAFLTEIPVETLHDGVLAGCWTFAELSAAAKAYRIDDAERRRWFEEMARADDHHADGLAPAP
jgi:hypothetical protein